MPHDLKDSIIKASVTYEAHNHETISQYHCRADSN